MRGLWVPWAERRCDGRRSHSSDCGFLALCQLSPRPAGRRGAIKRALRAAPPDSKTESAGPLSEIRLDLA